MIKAYDFSENESQDGNDLICLFYGGVLEPSFGGGDQYRFDAPETPEALMKCPPFGVLPRCSRSGELSTRMMRFHWDYNHLMIIIKECWNKSLADERLKQAYSDIKDELCVFPIGGSCLWAHRKVLEFIELYNELKNVEKEKITK